MNEASAAVPPPREFRPPLSERIGVTVAALFIGALTLFHAGAAIASFAINLFLGAFMSAIAAILAALTALVAKEAVARWRLRATVFGGRLTATLPRRRGFIDQPRVAADLDLRDYDRIETRVENFTGLGVTTAQRAYSLVKTTGERLELGADREFVRPFFKNVIDALVSRTGIDVVDLGVVDGNSGFLLVAGQSVPDWSAPSLSDAEIAVREKRRGRTRWIMLAAAALVIAARALSPE
jgi:hypothetical protein